MARKGGEEQDWRPKRSVLFALYQGSGREASLFWLRQRFAPFVEELLRLLAIPGKLTRQIQRLPPYDIVARHNLKEDSCLRRQVVRQREGNAIGRNSQLFSVATELEHRTATLHDHEGSSECEETCTRSTPDPTGQPHADTFGEGECRIAGSNCCVRGDDSGR